MKNTKKLLVIVILLLLLIFGTISFILCNSSSKPTTNREISNTQQEASFPNANVSDSETAYTEIIGFGQLTLSKINPNINLINSEENDVYLSFDVFYNNELIYQSGLIEPGKMEQANIYELLDAGEYTLTYSIGSYDLKTKEVYWTGIQQKQEIIVNK